MIATGTRLGSYRVDALIGQGGMGQVYRASDTRLDRTVAIKVLPPHLASHPQVRERFEREARAISSLSHPHICTLFDVGMEGDTPFLVMEYLEGESLADRLMRGPLPMDEAVRIAIQIADALSRAHRTGITHRDLKPGNVMLTKAGAKLLDFGLAKTGAFAQLAPDAPTEQHKPLTAEGTVVGTFQYMAPEQLEGQEVDARTDIFAFGALLYEMITGRRAFDGKTRTSLIAAIVGGQPTPVGDLQPLSTPALEHVIGRCLEKNPDDRWQSIADVSLELQWLRNQRPAADDKLPARRRLTWIFAGLGAFAFAGILVFALRDRQGSSPMPLVQSTLAAPPGVTIDPAEEMDLVVLSPDGRHVAFTGRDPDGRTHLWVRSLRDRSVRALPGTDGARHPFWSADSQGLAFFSKGKLRRVALDGAPPLSVCDVGSNPIAGDWNATGVILFSHAAGGPIYRVGADGGTPVAVTTVDAAKGETTHRWARFLPDGKRFLYLAASHVAPETSEVNALYAAALDAKERTLIARARGNAEISGNHLLLVRQNELIAQEIDVDSLTLKGRPQVLAKGVHQFGDAFYSGFSVSAAGMLTYHTAREYKQEAVWLDSSGKASGQFSKADRYASMDLSPDGKTFAITIDDANDGRNLWLQDVATGTLTRIETGSLSEHPIWSPDGRRLAYVEDAVELWSRNVQGDPEPRRLRKESIWGGPTGWSPDGKSLAVWEFDPNRANLFDAMILDVASGNLRQLAATKANEFPGGFSRDGRWLLYFVSESGRSEMFVASYPDLVVRKKVTTHGAPYGFWSDARTIWYPDAKGTWWSTTLTGEGETAQFSAPSELFTDPTIVSLFRIPDSDRLLAVRRLQSAQPREIVLVSDWKLLLPSIDQ
jgi:serine/threonine protein kinase/Tol biopolymer transport system component